MEFDHRSPDLSSISSGETVVGGNRTTGASAIAPAAEQGVLNEKAEFDHRSPDPSISGSSSSEREKELTGNQNTGDDVITPEAEQDVTVLARRLSRMSTSGAADSNPFNSSDPELQPNSEQFNPRKWVKALMKITSRDPEVYPTRTAGVTFENLCAHGFGSLQDQQKNVGNLWMEGVEYARNLLSGGRPGGKRGERKIQILRNFDGLVRSGEMLVVLGRPGR